MIHLYLRRYINLKAQPILLLFLLISMSGLSQLTKDSAIAHIYNLSSLYEKKALTERQYLDTVQESMMLFQSNSVSFTNKELLQLLTDYRDVIWEGRDNERFKQAYYAILSNQARLEGRNGEMFYYTEKLSELEKRTHTPPITSIFYIATHYYADLAYEKVVTLYTKNQKFITTIPDLVLKGQLERRELMRSSDMLSCLGSAAYKLKDSLRGQEIAQILSEVSDNIHKAYPTDKEILARLQYSVILNNHEKNLSRNNYGEIWKNIRQLDSLLHDPHTPEYLKSYVGFMATDKKALFFLDTKKNDSAAYYIDKLGKLYGDKMDPMNAYMVKKYQARLLYNKGHFKESEDTLVKALEILEARNRNSGAEVDEIMYALTKVEEQQLLLANSAKKQKRSERQFIALGFGAFLLLGGSILSFGIARHRQKTRFVDFKLNLARNIHDETNPALLYAKMLAKNRRTDPLREEKDELEIHIEHTMELIRNLSQDLKSDQQLVLEDLLKDTGAMLDKISALSGFSYSIQDTLDKKRFLSHYQYTNLKAILQECITNSIKHADFKRIDIIFAVEANLLKISYRDDGQGWPVDLQANGQGLQNIRDRIKKLNGDIVIKNSYPHGFRIDMNMKLS